MLAVLAYALHMALFLVFVLEGHNDLYLVDAWTDDEDRARLERNARRYLWAYALLLVACAVLDILLWRDMPLIFQVSAIALGAVCAWRVVELVRPPSNEDASD